MILKNKQKVSYFIFIAFILIISCTTPLRENTETITKPQMLPAPQILPSNADTVDDGAKISIVYNPKDATVLYTVDGSEPAMGKDGSAEYSAPFTITGDSVLVRARSFKNGFISSYITEKEYKINKSVYLSSLTLSEGTIEFSSAKYSYNCTVENSVENTMLTFDTGVDGVSYMINGAATSKKSHSIPLEVGSNTVTVTVSKGEISAVYTLKIVRKSLNPSNDASLSNLKIIDSATDKEISTKEIFSSSTKNYTASVSNTVSMVCITASPTVGDVASVVINDKDGTSGTVTLKDGDNEILVKVVAEDGTTNTTYKLTINRGTQTISDNAFLSGLSLKEAVFAETFSRSTTKYSATIDISVSSVNFDISTEDTNATYTINGVSGSIVQINIGKVNTIKIKVTAEDKTTTKEYTVVITSETLPVTDEDNAYLKTLSITGVDITPVFSRSNNSYTATVDNTVTSLVVAAAAEYSGASLTIDGKSSPLTISDLKEGTNVVTISCVSESKKYTKYYCVTITRKKAPVTGKIVLHAKKYTWVYLWGTTDTELNGSSTALTDEGNDWGTKTINVTSANIIFKNSETSWDGKTPDLSRTEGEWWYKDSKWTDYNPDDDVLPVVSLLSPADNASVTGIIDLSASATDNIGIAKVEFFADTALIGSVTTPPYTVSWDSGNISNGSYKIKAVATDLGGNQASTTGVIVKTTNSNKAPVAIAGSDRGSSVGKTITLDASSSYDPNGTIAGYLWEDSNGDKQTTAKASYTFSSTGTYTITLTVTDNDGATSSDTVNINIRDQIVRNDFREESIYFLMTTRFYDGDSSNNRYCRADDTSGNRANDDPPWRGDFKGLIEKLDYIKALGFTAIWITPVLLNRSEYDFHGYHTWDFTQIDPRLESGGASYQDLIDAVHERGMKIIQDIVLNHSCRYGIKDVAPVKFWGDVDDPDWGDGSKIDYYDVPNPSFTYNGLDYEPISGKTWYNGDLYQKAPPTLPSSWNSNLAEWGIKKGTNNIQLPWYEFQWPTEAAVKNIFDPNWFHRTFLKNWEDETCQTGAIHEDCIDLNTESKVVQDYLIDSYNKLIDMGVDGFRVDTVKHINRLMFNRRFIPAFKERGGDEFFLFGEVCTRVNEIWNKGNAPLSTPFFTWKERKTYSSDDETAVHEQYIYEWDNGNGVASQPKSTNHQLNGNEYHAPDYSQYSGMSVIDFPMHWNFDYARNAFNIKSGDQWYNDATWNVTYVESHDYSPIEGPNDTTLRYNVGTDAWAENMSLIWTFRGIPCLFYGDEIEFKKGLVIDKGPSIALEDSGRAYFGDHITGSVNVTDFGEYSNASGSISTTLNTPLALHIQALNKIRLAVPALQKGQYSTENITGSGMAFKRRFTDSNTDSFALVTISGDATFSNVPAGTYVDVVTGDRKTVSNGGSLIAACSGTGNIRVYVLDTAMTSAPGQIATSDWLK